MTVTQIPTPSRPTHKHACQYLATRGKRYLIDYGYDNAIALAERLGWQVPPSLGITRKAGDTYGF